MTQSEVLALLGMGQSMLITGAAGTGKTYVLSEFIRQSRRRGKNIAVTATTGLAATHLGGSTIHAWSGIGIHDALRDGHAKNLSKQRQELIRKADILVIDEISMLHDFRLDMVDEIARTIREDTSPFGGLQVVLSGDFFQLPPVSRGGASARFVTESAVWQAGAFQVGYLTEQFRQADDMTYTEILNGIRAGQLTRRQLDTLLARKDAVMDPWAAHTRLLTTNADVDSINAKHLAELTTTSRTYEMTTTGSEQYIEQLMRSCLALPLLELRIGAHVMCIKNSPDRRYVNGSLGVVREFEPDTGYPVVELVSGRTLTISPDTWELMDGDRRRATLTQLPLRLAWAITVHKSQGMTLDAARIDLANAFIEGMGYVALSRVKGLQHLVLDGMNTMALRTSSVARALDTQLRAQSEEAQTTQRAAIDAWLQAHQQGMSDISDEQANSLELDPVVYAKLDAWRAATAAAQHKPAYLVASNKLLEQLAARLPQSEAELRRVKGIGEAKATEYGKDILQITSRQRP